MTHLSEPCTNITSYFPQLVLRTTVIGKLYMTNCFHARLCLPTYQQRCYRPMEFGKGNSSSNVPSGTSPASLQKSLIHISSIALPSSLQMSQCLAMERIHHYSKESTMDFL